MVRVGVSVEGLTEKLFIEVCLAPYFLNKNMILTPISLDGNISVDRIRSELKKLLNNFDFITTFYDFYGFKKKEVGETKESLEKRILDAMPENSRERVISYIQVYEFESLLFSSPEIMEDEIGKKGLSDWATHILDAFNQNPEAINDSPQTAPSKRLEKESTYVKTLHGPNIALAIGIDELRSQCEGFDGWITRLEALGH